MTVGQSIRTPAVDAAHHHGKPHGTPGLAEALLEHTTERSAAEYARVLDAMGFRTTREVLSLSSGDMNQLKLTPHLRSVLCRVRGEAPGVLHGTPLDGHIARSVMSPDNLIYVLPLILIANFMVGGGGFFDLFERLLSMVVLCAILAALVVRSFYLLMAEEELGQIRLQRQVDPTTGEPSKEFIIRVTVHGTPGDQRSSVTHVCNGKGDDVGIMVHEIILHPLLIYLGFCDRLSWSSVVSVDPESSQHHHALTLAQVNPSMWQTLESLPFIPGIRAIQRAIVFKTAVDGAVYLVKKDPHGRVWLAQGH